MPKKMRPKNKPGQGRPKKTGEHAENTAFRLYPVDAVIFRMRADKSGSTQADYFRSILKENSPDFSYDNESV